MKITNASTNRCSKCGVYLIDGGYEYDHNYNFCWECVDKTIKRKNVMKSKKPTSEEIYGFVALLIVLGGIVALIVGLVLWFT